MPTPTLPAILCVDDEPRVLEGLSMTLRRQFVVTIAKSGADGLAALQANAGFAVVMSDMRMPGMDGASFLSRARAAAPDSIRVLLTGEADLQTAIAAVNEGQIFRFLTKPCPPELLVKTLQGAVEQYALVTAQKELLEKTLHGSIRALIDVLSIASPTTFGRATRIKRLAGRLGIILKVTDRWALEVAAMLSQIGYVVLPSQVAEKMFHGKSLAADEREMVERGRALTRQIVAKIPRMEAISDILEYSQRNFAGTVNDAADVLRGEKMPIGSRILHVALDYDSLADSGSTHDQILVALAARAGLYDPRILTALKSLSSIAKSDSTMPMKLTELTPGMIIADDVKTTTGTLLVGRGHEITDGSLQRLLNFSLSGGIKEPIIVMADADVI